MKYQIHTAVVIGSGTMGAAIAAHLANAGVPVTLLDIVPKDAPADDKEARNKIVREGWQRCLKAKPANLMSPELKTFVKLGNLEDDFDVVAEADWVCEAIVENLEIKQKLMRRIDEMRKPNGIVTTNTSGIPVHAIAEGRSKEFRKHFLGTHFFNPPRYLKLLEIIPTKDTAKEVVEFISHFGEYRLGKGIVLCKDTPNFIGNRIAFGTGAFAMDFILKNGYTVDEVDAITGPLIGRPKTATFRLIDLVGLDVWDHVGGNLAPLIPHDKLGQEYLKAEAPGKLMSTMLERKWLGNKTKVGFYKEVRGEDGKKEFWPLDLNTLEHVPPTKPRFDSVKEAKGVEGLVVVSCDAPADSDTLDRRHSIGADGVVIVLPRELPHLKALGKRTGYETVPFPPPPREHGAIGRIRAMIEGAMDSEDISPYLLALEPLFERYDAAEVAAAAVALLRKGGGSDREQDTGRVESAAARATATPSWAKLFVGVGERDGLRAGDLLGAITGEADVPGDSVGKIEIKESHSIVEVHDSVARRVIQAINGTTIKGRSVRADYDRPRRTTAKRPRR